MISGHFIDSQHGNLYVTQIGEIGSNEAVVCLPPIFEELNLSRAVIAKQGQYFAKQGKACFILDYIGTGDSQKHYDEVTVDMWLDNVIDLSQWLESKGVNSVTLWGVRFGALLALVYQKKLHEVMPIKAQLLWKPVLQGKNISTQMFRVKQASEMMQNAEEKVNWRERVLDGELVEVAGYPLNKAFLESLESLKFDKKQQPCSPIAWLELGSETVSPGVTRNIGAWAKNRYLVESQACPQFWQSPEIFALEQGYQFSADLLVQLSEVDATDNSSLESVSESL